MTSTTARASLTAQAQTRFDAVVLRLATGPARLIGLSVLRVIIGVAGVMFYVSDYGDRQLLWGPNGYLSIADARGEMEGGAFSLYTFSHSQVWFELVFHVGLLAAIAFTIFGGRVLTVVHAVFLWSIYLRNQDILEGGDNFARIALIFMVFTVSNAYLAPGAAARRAALAQRSAQPTVVTLLHNVATKLIVFQVAVLYFVAGYLKATASIWTNGTAMYYVSRIHEFSMWGVYPDVMNNLAISWVVSYCTIVFEVAVPFVILTRRAWLRKIVTLGLESMHLGIMIFMGLVCFGLIMIGADSTLLKDSDYRSLGALAGRLRAGVGERRSGARRREVTRRLAAARTASTAGRSV